MYMILKFNPPPRQIQLWVCTVRITWKPEYAGPPYLFSLPHRAHVVVENLGTEGAHTYFSVIRLLWVGTASVGGGHHCARPLMKKKRRDLLHIRALWSVCSVSSLSRAFRLIGVHSTAQHTSIRIKASKSANQDSDTLLSVRNLFLRIK